MLILELGVVALLKCVFSYLASEIERNNLVEVYMWSSVRFRELPEDRGRLEGVKKEHIITATESESAVVFDWGWNSTTS